MPKSDRLAQLEKENRTLRRVLENLVDMYVANRGRADSEFISCITPSRHAVRMTPAERRLDETWNAWDLARIALGEEIPLP